MGRLKLTDADKVELDDAPAAAPGRMRLSANDRVELDDGATAGPAPSMTESALRGLKQGATLGFGDELTGALGALGAIGSDESFSDAYKRHRDEARENDRRARDANPWTYGLSELGGGVATSFVPGLGIARGATALQTAGKAALLGGVSGLGASEREDVGGQLADAGTSAALSGATAGILSKFLGGAPERSVRRAIGDITDGATATQRDRVVGKAGARVNDVLQVMRSEPAIRKAGSDAGRLFEAMEGALRSTGEKLDAVYASAGKATPGVRVSDVLGRIEKIANSIADDPGKADLERAIRAKAMDVLEKWGDRTHVPLGHVRELASDVADAAFKGSPAISPKQGQAMSQRVWGELKDLISENLDEAAKAGGPGAKEAAALNKRMSTLLNMREAVRYRATREATESTRLKDRVSQGLDLGLALADPSTFVAKKGYDFVGRPAARAIDDKILAPLVQAARAGSTSAAIAQRALEMGASPVIANSLAKWAVDKFGVKSSDQ